MKYDPCPNCGTKNPEDIACCLYCGQTLDMANMRGCKGRERESGVAARTRPEKGVLITLAACVVVPLAFSVHAYLAKSTEPWGRALSLPFWFAGAVVLGAGIGLYLLLYPRRAWVLWARCCGLAALVLLVSSVRVLEGAYRRSEYLRPSEVTAVCRYHEKFLAMALSTYAVEGEAFAIADEWQSVASRYLAVNDDVAKLSTCPAVPALTLAYAYNTALAGVMYSALDDPAHTVVLFESDHGEDAASGPELLPDEPRHFGGDNYGFADGHVQWLPRKKNPDGAWAKEPDANWVIWEPVLKEGEGEVSAEDEDP